MTRGTRAHIPCMVRLNFHGVKNVNHHLCDILLVLQLSCTTTCSNELAVCLLIGWTSCVHQHYFHLYFYHQSAPQRAELKLWFSTSGSCIMIISLFFWTTAFIYLSASNAGPMGQGNISSVVHTNFGPILSPIRNVFSWAAICVKNF